jgi:hypothetical protein
MYIRISLNDLIPRPYCGMISYGVTRLGIAPDSPCGGTHNSATGRYMWATTQIALPITRDILPRTRPYQTRLAGRPSSHERVRGDGGRPQTDRCSCRV